MNGIRDELETELKSHTVFAGNLRPNYSGFGLSNLPSTIASHLGCRIPGASVLSRKVDDFDADYSTVILLLVDGMGWNLIKSLAKDNRYLADLSNKFPPSPLTTVFPSTTSTAITTLSTGKSPGEHGIIGYTMFVKELGTIVNMLDFKAVNSPKDETIFEKGIPPEEFLGIPTFYQLLSREGIQSFVLTKNYILGSGLSKITHAGAHLNGYVDVGDMFVILRRLLESNRGLRKYVFVYWPSVDTASHAFGPWSEETAAEMRSLFFSLQEEFLGKLPGQLRKNTLLLITADHGQSQIVDGGAFDASTDKEFMDMLIMPPTGDSRTAFLHVKEGREGNVEEHLKKKFGRSYSCMNVGNAIDLDLLGPGTRKKGLADRLGDLMILTESGRSIFYPFKPNSVYNQKGAHSGLTEDELLIPLFKIPLST